MKQEHEYFSKQFSLMTNLIHDMQNKFEYSFNRYNILLDKIESRVGVD